MKFNFFFALLENNLKNLYKIQQLAFFLHKSKKCIVTATKWSIIDFLNCRLQKVINKRFSWSSTFSSLFCKNLWKTCIKSNNWHILLHKFKRCIITATKWSITDYLTCRLQNVINKRFSWSSTFSWNIL